MDIRFAPEAWDDYLWWQKNDPKTVDRVHLLLKEIVRDPFKGIGKPEPLKHALRGQWSRRITGEHRLVYKVMDNQLQVLQMRLHY